MNCKVLVFHPQNDYTGSTNVLSIILQDKFQHTDVAVISDYTNDGFLSFIDVTKINLPSFRIKGKRIPILSILLTYICGFFIALLQGRRFDVFYINTIQPFYATIAGKIIRKRIVYHVHEISTASKSLQRRISEFFVNNTRCSRIFVSNFVKEQYRKNPANDDRIEYNKLSNRFIEQIRRTPIDERKRNRILMVSSLSIEKGVYQFLKLAEINPQYDFLLILSVDEEVIKSKLSEYYFPNLTILPKQNSIHHYLSKTDIMLNLTQPSMLVETYGMTILEAMAYGIPSVVPDKGGPTELVKDTYNGRCVDVENIQVISLALKEILDKSNYTEYCNNSLTRFNQLFR